MSGDIKTWLEYLDHLTDLIKAFSLENTLKYLDKLSTTIDILIKEKKLSEFIYPSLNLLVSTIQQLVLVELSAKASIVAIMSDMKSILKRKNRELDKSDLTLF